MRQKKYSQNVQACLGHPESERVNKNMQNVCMQSHRSYIEIKTTYYNFFFFLKLTALEMSYNLCVLCDFSVFRSPKDIQALALIW